MLKKILTENLQYDQYTVYRKSDLLVLNCIIGILFTAVMEGEIIYRLYFRVLKFVRIVYDNAIVYSKLVVTQVKIFIFLSKHKIIIFYHFEIFVILS